MTGRPLAYALVAPIFTVCAATWAAVRLNLIVVGVLSPRNCTAGKLLVALVPTVYVTGPQLFMRTSEGCMLARLSPLSNSRGVPSQSPMRQMAAVALGSAVMARVPTLVDPPAVTVAVPVQTASSPL